jgi:hypothetical protein
MSKKKPEPSIQERIDSYGSRRLNRFDRENMFEKMKLKLIKPLRERFTVQAREFLDLVLEHSMTEIQWHHFNMLPADFFVMGCHVEINRTKECSEQWNRIKVDFEYPWHRPNKINCYCIAVPASLHKEHLVLEAAYVSIHKAEEELTSTIKPIVFSKVTTFKGLFTLFPELLEYCEPPTEPTVHSTMSLVPIQQARSLLSSLEKRVLTLSK